MMRVSGISVFFPFFNEEENITRLVEEAHSYLKTRADDFEILMINDGSTDGTKKAARELEKKYAGVRLISHPENMGYGAALKTGFSSAAFPLIFFTDGDNQFRITDMDILLSHAGEADIVAGYRIDRQDNFLRRLNGFMYNRLIRIMFGIDIRDIDCAFKLIKKSVFEKVTLEADSILVSAELFIRAKKYGLRIYQAGIRHYPREKGIAKGNKLSFIIDTFLELAKLRSRLK